MIKGIIFHNRPAFGFSPMSHTDLQLRELDEKILASSQCYAE
jgi:hypothetical protein